MKEIKIFVCEICGTRYDDKCNAEQCEKSHNFANKIEKNAYSAFETYPDKIEVCFTNGVKRWYYK